MKLPYIIGNLLNTHLNPILHPVFRCNHDRSRNRNQSNQLALSLLRKVSNRIVEQTPTWFKEGTEINWLVERERERERERRRRNTREAKEAEAGYNRWNRFTHHSNVFIAEMVVVRAAYFAISSRCSSSVNSALNLSITMCFTMPAIPPPPSFLLLKHTHRSSKTERQKHTHTHSLSLSLSLSQTQRDKNTHTHTTHTHSLSLSLSLSQTQEETR